MRSAPLKKSRARSVVARVWRLESKVCIMYLSATREADSESPTPVRRGPKRVAGAGGAEQTGAFCKKLKFV